MKNILFLLLISPLLLSAQNQDAKPTSVKDQDILEKCIAGDCKNGEGTMQYKTGIYKGTWAKGLRDGKGVYTWNNGDVYTGQWSKDKRHGYGEYVWHDGSKYHGNYSYGIRSGFGIYYYTNGTRYEGTWQNNLKHGIANYYNKQSVNYGGKYVNNKYVEGTGITQSLNENQVSRN